MQEKDLHITDERELRKDQTSEGKETASKNERKSISPYATNLGSISSRVIQSEVSRLRQMQSKRKSDVPSEIWLG